MTLAQEMLRLPPDDVMILCSEEVEILDYLNACRGGYVSMVEICRCAGGRQKFRDSPSWARQFMTRLIEAGLIESNDRGHYRRPLGEPNTTIIVRKDVEPAAQETSTEAEPREIGVIVGDNYFPAGPAEPDPMIDPAAPAPWVPRSVR